MEEEISLNEQEIMTHQNKCKSCGSNINFDIDSGELKCSNCGTIKDIDDDNDKVERRQITEEIINSHQKWTEGKVFSCKNCGAKEVLEVKTIAANCAFCGSAQIISIDELPGIRPDSVIPFQITEQTANNNFKKWIGARWIAPSSFRKSSDIRERMSKIYTPCWSFSAKTKNQYSGVLGRTVTVHIRTKNGIQTRTQTNWFKVNGQINQDYIDHFFQSGERISSRSFNDLKPFDLKKIKIYRQEYLSGIIAEHYSRTISQCFNEFSMYVRRDLQNRIIRKHSADRVQNININTNFLERQFNYVLLPIYISNYTYNGKLYNFYVNGATGKVVGRYPKSKMKIFLIGLGVTVLVGLGVGAALFFGGFFN